MSRIPPRIEQVIDGKEVEGYEVLPITEDGISYFLSEENEENEQKDSIGCHYYIAAQNISTGEIFWKTEYYMVPYDPDMERDVQWVFPVDMYIQGNTIIIKLEYYSENDRIFSIMKASGDIKMKSPY